MSGKRIIVAYPGAVRDMHIERRPWNALVAAHTNDEGEVDEGAIVSIALHSEGFDDVIQLDLDVADAAGIAVLIQEAVTAVKQWKPLTSKGETIH